MNRQENMAGTVGSYSLRGQVFHKIREDILSGRYRKDDELKEMTIAAELGVSRTPVREAIRQLELEGLIKTVPNKGAYVTGISTKDIQDIFVMRSMLEGLCARWAVSYITKEQIDALEEILCLEDYYYEKGNTEPILELDNKFHMVLYDASGSDMLKHTLSDFHHYLERVRKVTLASKERAKDSNLEHKYIVEAIKEKDGELAEQLANRHIMASIHNIEEWGIENLLNAQGQSMEKGRKV